MNCRSLARRLVMSFAPVLLVFVTGGVPAHAAPSSQYTSIGDSLTAGVGASNPGTTDFVPQVNSFLGANRGAFTLTNRGQSGAVAPDLTATSPSTPSVQRDQLANAVSDNPNVVTLTVGGNDVLHIAGVDAGAETLAQFDASLNTILSSLRTAPSNPFIVLINVPDLSRLPIAAFASPAQKAALKAIVIQVNASISTRAAQYSVPVVDLFNDPQSYDPANISGDGFHPNDAGYAILAADFNATLGSPRIVLNTNDAGSGSLRQAIQDADQLPSTDTITFDPTVFGTAQTITLSTGELKPGATNQTLTIQGPGADLLSVSGNNAGRVFEVPSGTVNMAGMTITGGSTAVSGGNGGGVLVDSGAVLGLTACTVTENNSGSQSGGVFSEGGGIFSSGTLIMTACAVVDNTTTNYSGGIGVSGGTALLTNCTVADNTDTFNSGSGLDIYGGAVATLVSCTVTGNSSSGTGGIFNEASGTLTLQATIVAGNTTNTVGPGPDIQNDGTFTSNGSNLIGDNTGGPLFPPGAHDQVGTAAAPLDPGLDPAGPADNGGPTPTVALVPGSLAIDADFSLLPPATDQRGIARPQAVRADIGAVEFSVPVVAVDDSYSTTQNGTLIVPAPGVLGNDTGVGNPLTAVQVSGPAHGVLTLNSDGSFTYTPALNFFGTDTFTYQAHDTVTNNNSSPATVTITVAPAPPPTANADAYNVAQNGTLIVPAPGVLSNDTGVGNPLTAVQVSGPAHGVLTLNSDGSFTYTPALNFFGTDTFTYQAHDTVTNNNSSPATVTITVLGPPTATAQSVTVREYIAQGITLSGTDPNTPPSALTYALTSSPTHGTLTGFDANAGTVTYTPNSGYFGPDSFQFTVSNGTSTSSPATVSLNITPAAAMQYLVTAPAAQAAGTPFSVTITAQDAAGRTANGYTGTVHLTSTDGQAVLPADATLTGGVGQFTVTLTTGGAQTVTATDVQVTSLTGVSNTIAVQSGAATHLSVTAPSSATAGSAFSITVTALDKFGNTVTGYTGTVRIAATDGQAVLPPNAALLAGTGQFTVTLKTSGAQAVTARDSQTAAIAGTSGAITVGAATSGTVAFVQQPTTVREGTIITPSPSVKVTDAFGNPIAGTTVTLTLLAPGTGTLGGTLTQTTGADGVATFSDLTCSRPGQKTLRAAAGTTLTAASQPFTVTADDVLAAQGVNVSANTGKSVTAATATFTDTDVSSLAADFTATINWGDGSTQAPDITSATVTGSNGRFTVTGTHIYAQSGTYALRTRITDTQSGGPSATATSAASAAPAIAHVFPAGLQLFSVPADYSGVALGVALGTTLSQINPKLAVWSPTLVNYVVTPTAPADALRPGQGYWARFGDLTNLYDVGTPTPTTAPFSIALHAGWNMIGDPFPSAVSLANVQVQANGKAYPGLSVGNSAGLVAFTLYSYPAGATAYQMMDGTGSLQPYTGYWLYAFAPCTLLITSQ